MPGQVRSQVYEFGSWQVHLGRRELLTDGVAVSIGPRAFEVIETLVQSANDLVTKDSLMDRIWPGAIVGENTLQVHISTIRKALGQDRSMLQTVSGRGYRLIGPWTGRDDAICARHAELAPIQHDVARVRGNLPAAAAAVIGRAAAALQIQDLLSSHRVVTLAGPGGVGKTTLALDVARALDNELQGDVWLAELASLSDPALVSPSVADVLHLNAGCEEIVPEAVALTIGHRKLLLVLDNCEHLIDAAARLVETLVLRCPHASVMVTSREPLRISGECVYRVPPLDVPPQCQGKMEDVLGHSAVQLFVARLQALDSTFEAHGENVRSIAAICQHLDGLPLGIEFAATRAATLGVQFVASHLDDRFNLLVNGRRTATPRHQTLRASFDWSYELLSETERRLLNRLAIFDAEFTLEAATAVMNDAGDVTSPIVEGVANLVAKSLVSLARSGPSGRWVLLGSIRAYALEKLAESGEAEVTARRYAMFDRDRFDLMNSIHPAKAAM